ncbi:MAG: hypothetical protein K2X11_19300 [Acetobacteraceae bacterium]|nr:hypothetical protein [Acetobacteraceae bacterium]
MEQPLADPRTVAYLARRGVAQQWRGFLRALLETLDTHLDAASRDSLLRAVGARMAAFAPLPACASLSELEARINDALAAADWGYASLSLDVNGKALVVSHAAAPAVGTQQDPTGGWIAAVLEGLYGAWFATQPGAEASVPVTRAGNAPGSVVLRYARG